MNIIISKISLKIVTLISLSLVGFYLLNHYTGIAHDDYLFKFIVNYNKLADTRVESISDILYSMYNHYLVTNGRILLNGLAQLFLLPDNKLWFNISNTLIFGLFQLLILKRSTCLKTTDVYQYLVLILSLWFLIPMPNQTFLWLDGSLNYLWGMTIILLFLDVFYKLKVNNIKVKNRYLAPILAFGFIAGFTHEAITLGLSGALIIQLLRRFRLNKISSLVLILGFLLGTFIMIISPGNLNRFLYSGLENVAFFDIVLQRCIRFVYFILSVPNAFWVLMILFFILYLKDKKGLKEVYKKQELLIHSIFISLGFIFFSGSSSYRAFFGVHVFSIIIVLATFHNYSRLVFSTIGKTICVVLSIITVFEFAHVTSELRANKIDFDRDEEHWFNSDENVFLLREKNKNRFIIHEDPSDKFFGQNSRLMNLYYGKELMLFIPKELYENVYESKRFLDDKRLLNSTSLKKSSDTIKFYKTESDKFLILKIADSISQKFSDRPQVKYQSDQVLKNINSDYLSRFKGFLLNTSQESLINAEMTECFVLPTSHGNYLILHAPLIIPFENLEEIIIYPSRNDNIPILSF